MPPSARAGFAGTGVCAAGPNRVDSQRTRERRRLRCRRQPVPALPARASAPLARTASIRRGRVNGSKPDVTDLVWALGRPTIGGFTRLVAPLRVYGAERVPRQGGVVLALNHFSWLDPPAYGAACPRTIYYMAKIEAHRAPGLGQLIRAFGTFSVRRGESDREAVRIMRQVVREGNVLGLFVEGTRQRSGVPGIVQPGAAMVALQEGVPVVPVAIHGTQHWK